MLRQVMIPSKEKPSFSFPVEYYGREVEVLVFPSPDKSNQSMDDINKIFDKHLFSFENYKFDRDEANDYD